MQVFCGILNFEMWEKGSFIVERINSKKVHGKVNETSTMHRIIDQKRNDLSTRAK